MELRLILTLEITFAIFLIGVLGIALAITLRHGDPNARYGLYAVRAKLIDACVLRGISRTNPWLDSHYQALRLRCRLLSPLGLLGEIGLDAVAIGVDQERGVVAGAVVGAQAGRAVVAASGGEAARVEGVDGFAARGREAEVQA